MTDVASRLKDELLQLSEDDRLALARVLLESVGPEDDVAEDEAAWIEELNRRSDDLAAGRATAQPFREAIEELRQEALRESRLQ
jgi:putative addiction module component (TIGR02574 family)